jgi:hypothetical protein
MNLEYLERRAADGGTAAHCGSVVQSQVGGAAAPAADA